MLSPEDSVNLKKRKVSLQLTVYKVADSIYENLLTGQETSVRCSRKRVSVKQDSTVVTSANLLLISLTYQGRRVVGYVEN